MTSRCVSTENLVQEKPVSSGSGAEQQSPVFSLQPNVAEHAAGNDPASLSPVEGLGNNVEGERSSPFLLELFCGTAGVCAQFKARGGRALGIDHHLKRTRLKAAAVKLDLTQKWVQELIRREISLGRVHAMHLGPPCGHGFKGPQHSSESANCAAEGHQIQSHCEALVSPWDFLD